MEMVAKGMDISAEWGRTFLYYCPWKLNYRLKDKKIQSKKLFVVTDISRVKNKTKLVLSVLQQRLRISRILPTKFWGISWLGKEWSYPELVAVMNSCFCSWKPERRSLIV